MDGWSVENAQRSFKDNVNIPIHRIQFWLGCLTTFLPLVDLITDYFGAFKNLADGTSVMSKTIGIAMLINLIIGPCFTGKAKSDFDQYF